jgi:hypothetical protein
VLRTVWAGAVATVTAGGLLFAAMPGGPGPDAPGGGREIPVLAQARAEAQIETRARESVESRMLERADRVETVPEQISPAQIMAVLERAQREAREQGADFSPAVAQAAAELGLLYATYTAQQQAAWQRDHGLRIQDAPVARRTEQDDDKEDAHEHDGGRGDGERSTPSDQVPSRDVVSVVPASYKLASAAEHDMIEHGASERDEAHDHSAWVTYEEVVLAAVRLANLLDGAVPGTEVEVLRADPREELLPGQILTLPDAKRQGMSRQSLRDLVSTFGASTTGYANGRIPAGVLCPLNFARGHLLRCDAARQLTALSVEFEDEFGYSIPVTDSYRSFGAQVAVAVAKPHLAAVPGTSNHGWGLAVDLSDPISGGASPEYVWLRVHGPRFGWDNPSWARPDGSKPEPWHFEFFAAGPVPDRAIDPSDVDTGYPTTTATIDQAHGKKSDTEDRAKKSGTRKEGKKDDHKKGSTKETGLGPEAGPPSKGRPSDEETRKPAKPADTPSTKPTPKPGPTPKPSLPSPEPSARPAPSPSPAQPSQQPSANPIPPKPAPTPTLSTPTSSPSSSESPGALSGLVRGLGLGGD